MKRIRTATIATILRHVGYLRKVDPVEGLPMYAPRQLVNSPKTITEIAKATGINQTRLKPIIRDLHDSQLIDVVLQRTTFRRLKKSKTESFADMLVEAYQPSHERYSMPRWKVPRIPGPKIPEGLNPSEEFEFRVRNVGFMPLPIPQRDFYFRFYRTEWGDAWLKHYSKFPHSWKTLTWMRDENRISMLREPRTGSELTPNEIFENHIRSIFGLDTPVSHAPVDEW